MDEQNSVAKKTREEEIIEKNFALQQEILKNNNEALRLNKYTLIATATINGLMSLATIGLFIYTLDIYSSTKDLRDNSQKQIRPYVVVSDVSSENDLTSDMLVRVNVKNVGQSPAYGVYESTVSYFGEKDSEKSDQFSVLTNRPDCSAAQTGPLSIGSTDVYGFYVPKMDAKTKQYIPKFDQASIDEFKKGNAMFFVQMFMCYSDVFKNLHHMQFCRYYVNDNNINKKVFYPCPFNKDYED